MVLLHSSWKFNGLAGIVMLMTGVVVVSGFIGRYIYTAIPRSSDGMELEANQLESGIQALEAEITAWIKRHPELSAPVMNNSLVAVSGTSSGIGNPLGMLLYRIDLWRMRRRMDPQTREQSTALSEMVRRRRTLERQRTSLAQARRLMALWHMLHVPLGLALFTAAFIHISAAIYYATLLR
jgi:hypothetical protein